MPIKPHRLDVSHPSYQIFSKPMRSGRRDAVPPVPIGLGIIEPNCQRTQRFEPKWFDPGLKTPPDPVESVPDRS